MFFFEIGRDGTEILEVLSLTCAVFAVPLGARRQVLNEVVERPRGRAPGRSGRVLVNENLAAVQRITQKTLNSVS